MTDDDTSPPPPRTRKLFDGSSALSQELQLEVTVGAHAGRSVSCGDKPVRIGSGPDNELVLADGSVSRQHAVIEPGEGGFLVRDLASTNGTYVNDVRVLREAVLPAEGVLQLGTTIIRLQRRTNRIEISASRQTSFGKLVGRSLAMRRLFTILERAAPTAATILIAGPSGTGKEVVAQSIHEQSPRRKAPFVVLDCGAIDPQLVSSELFGHEAGAFTGAAARRAGVFEQAHRGTVFLDEIGELPLDLQPKLLRVLESRAVKRLGGNATIPLDVRVLSATNRDLQQMVRAGRFREDLFYRLSQLEIKLPALDARKEDIPLLVNTLLERLGEPGAPRRISTQALARLWVASYPGNVRQLRNIVERAAMIATGPVIEAADLLLTDAPGESDGGDAREGAVPEGPGERRPSEPTPDAEKQRILDALRDNGEVLVRAAGALGIAVNTLKARMRRLGIPFPQRPGLPGPKQGARS